MTSLTRSVVGPAVARAELDRLESAIVDPHRAQGLGAVPQGEDDETSSVPGSPEPPD